MPRTWRFPQTSPIITPGSLHPRFDVRRAGAAHVVFERDRLTML